MSMANKYFDGTVRNTKKLEEIDSDLIIAISNLVKDVDRKMEQLKVSDALECIINAFRKCNKYIDDTTPWTLAKDEANKERLETVIYNLLEATRINATILQSFLPRTSEKILSLLNVQNKTLDSVKIFGLNESFHTGSADIIFERIQ